MIARSWMAEFPWAAEGDATTFLPPVHNDSGNESGTRESITSVKRQAQRGFCSLAPLISRCRSYHCYQDLIYLLSNPRSITLDLFRLITLPRCCVLVRLYSKRPPTRSTASTQCRKRSDAAGSVLGSHACSRAQMAVELSHSNMSVSSNPESFTLTSLDRPSHSMFRTPSMCTPSSHYHQIPPSCNSNKMDGTRPALL